ncbi:pyruvate kinase [Ideonella sp. A 288]|uniref:pyruvate kinase n=1 Tax=Ideonella sp. A 288 TaxID=1962181 RepID=UPI000B4B3421|nr:pyruvate kinase [Ideonella sp. A 288]
MDTPVTARPGHGAWDATVCDTLIRKLQSLRAAMVAAEARLGDRASDIDPGKLPSARNLAHYLALRRVDLRELQERLAWIGVSSLGRAETHVLANLDKVLGILHVLAGREWTPQTSDEPVGQKRGPALLARHADALFGAAPAERAARIMVTLPSEAASDPALIEALVANGMDIARINCAHDDAAAWLAMCRQVRRAARQARRSVRVLMDLAGPKLRTGPIEPGPIVLRLKPTRDALGRLQQPARLGLRAMGSTGLVPGAPHHLGVRAAWLAQLRVGDRIDLEDARGVKRKLGVVDRHESGVLVEGARTAFITPQTTLRLRREGATLRDTAIDGLPATPGQLRLHRGDTLHLVRDGMGHGPGGPGRTEGGRTRRAAVLACTLPQALDAVRKGDRVWFDDGRIGAVARRRTAQGVELRITVARDGGEGLAADKGINLPDTALDLPALTDKDLEDLAVVAAQADLVGLSFAQSGDDVRQLRHQLQTLGAAKTGVILKIETRRGFEHLPEMLFAAMGASAAGVMIARGDLAVECGYERLAEVQEEILWACEAAHVPVVWATQVLETLAKTGLPTRAEITDAAMGERAECVMLNKGPHILDAMRMLADILQRMQSHQSKKRPLLRALAAWQPPAGDAGLDTPPTAPRARRAGVRR